MTRRKWRRYLGLSVLGAFVVVGTGTLYRAFIDRWEGDLRAPLIAAAMAGIAFFVLTLLTLSWVDAEKTQRNPSPKIDDRPTCPGTSNRTNTQA